MSDSDNGSLLWAANGRRFGTVLCDPPWPSGKRPNNNKSWLNQYTKPRYGTMKAADILALPVSDVAADDAMLVLWATWMHLPLAFQVIEAWGFTYATGMPWLKVVKHAGGPYAKGIMASPIYGPGVWFQHCTELVLLARRGSPFGRLGVPRPARKGIIVAPRQEHSRKPEELQAWVESRFPGPMLEMFARVRRDGWTSWGNELSDASTT